MTSSSELLEALESYLRDDLQPELAGLRAYQNRVAANLLAILRREEQFGPALEALDQAFARDHALDADAMPQALARALRDGVIDDDAGLRRFLRLRSLLLTTIDNPRYSGLAQARALWPEADTLESQ